MTGDSLGLAPSGGTARTRKPLMPTSGGGGLVGGQRMSKGVD